MKRFYSILICFSFLILFSVPLSARCIGPVVNGECLGTEVSGNDNSQDTYRGSSGTTYQYDLNNPLDQNSYLYDNDAQKRDQMNTDPRRGSDRKNGQRGGGINNSWLTD